MSKKADYSAEEWQAIAGAPVAAGLLITLSDVSGPAGIAREALAVGKAIAHLASGAAPEIVKALAENVASSGGRPVLPKVPTGDRKKTTKALIEVIKTAVRAVEKKSAAEVEGYKALLASVAAHAAQASKEGGFFGLGGTLVSADEEDALQQLTEVLGVGASHSTVHSRLPT
ncbi:MAG TPA: hypothetical protein VH679_01475 [Vicinamibacterales bacterium]|jgi:hypothetical protein